MPSSRLIAAAILAGTALAVLPLGAQNHPIIWSLSGGGQLERQGQPFRIALRAQIPSPWHLYSLTQALPPRAMTIRIGDTMFVLAGAATARDPEVAPDDNFGIVTETYLDSVTFAVPVTARFAGAATLHLKVGYQTCTDKMCLPFTEDTLELRIRAEPGAAVAAVVGAPPPPTQPPPSSGTAAGLVAATGPGAASTQSLPLFLWLAAVMGALSLLTPCVFPMIPITVSYFTRANETARGKPARNALVYAAGIIATFTVLGMAIAVLVGAGGINRFAANPWINLLVTAIFVAFALNLFGVYQIGVPVSVLTRLDGATRRAGGSETAGILLMGLTFTLTSFTCTTPFVGTLLVMAAQGSWLWPLSGLLVFSAVFALPFFLLALMPSALARLPRSGSWLQDVKVVMGFVELATAMKFLSNADIVLRWGVVTRSVVLAIWFLIAVLTALYLVGLVGRHASPVRLGFVRKVLAGAILVLAVRAGFRAINGQRMGELESFLPPPEGGIAAGSTSVAGELPWLVNDYDAGLARARAEHKQVLVDFTGYTCTNCRWMEANMFPRQDVVHELARFVRVRLYTDGLGEVYQRQQRMEQEKLGTVALPYYAIVDTLGDVKAQFLGMTRSTTEFVQFLRDGRSVTAP